jgi:hypothetical protein
MTHRLIVGSIRPRRDFLHTAPALMSLDSSLVTKQHPTSTRQLPGYNDNEQDPSAPTRRRHTRPDIKVIEPNRDGMKLREDTPGQ